MHSRGHIHGALSPDTIMVSNDGRVKLIDATMGPLLRKNAEARKRLNVAFLSPEEVRGEKPTASVNIYGLGCIFFQMLTGKPPFSGASDKETISKIKDAPLPDVTEIRPDLPKEVNAFVHGLLQKIVNGASRTRRMSLNILKHCALNSVPLCGQPPLPDNVNAKTTPCGPAHLLLLMHQIRGRDHLTEFQLPKSHQPMLEPPLEVNALRKTNNFGLR